MRQVFPVFWRALKDVWEELFMLVLMNLVTILLLLPVVTFPPALAGLWSVANIVAQGKSIAWSDYFGGFRKYFLKSWGLTLINLVVIALLAANVWFYTPDVFPFRISANLSFLIRAFWVSLLFVWAVLLPYPLALLLEQYDQRLRVALRNAFVLVFTNPGFALVLFVLLALLGLISVAIPAVLGLVGLAIIAVVCNKAVHHLLEPIRERAVREAEEAVAAETAAAETAAEVDEEAETDEAQE